MFESQLHHQSSWSNSDKRPQMKLFGCSYCTYVTNLKANLTNHVRTHTGEQPFQCSVCSLRFNVQSNLKRHMKRVHEQSNTESFT